MRMPPPVLKMRAYREILNEALARIPVHNPEWTNFLEPDPGITLLELFSFMTENLVYRSNLIPDRNRRKFLNLLGIPLRPPSAAEGVVVFSNERGPSTTVTLPPGLSLLAGKIGFVTSNALDVLPVEGRVYYRRRLTPSEKDEAEKTYLQLYGSHAEDPGGLEFYETTYFEPPAGTAAYKSVDLGGTSSVDGSLWVALLLRPVDRGRGDALRREVAGKMLTLGLMPAIQQAERVLSPGGSPETRRPAPLVYEIATGQVSSDGTPRYARLESVQDDNALQHLTLVQLTLPGEESIGTWNELDPLEEGVGEFPPSLEDEQIRERVLSWIRVRLDAPAEASLAARLAWVGIHAARVTQRVQIPSELVGTGTGEPDQSFALANAPVLPGTLQILVNGESWDYVDDLRVAPRERPERDPTAAGKASRGPSPKVFGVDGNRVLFGDGLRGMRPPASGPILASYAYGGGKAGNVEVGQIRVGIDLPSGLKVHNPLQTWKGDDGESVEDGERSIPTRFRNRDRAVSAEDFRDIVEQTPGVELGRVEILPLFQPATRTLAPGVVTVMVVPRDPRRPEGPEPDRLFLDAVCDHLEPWRLLTTEVFVRGPEYQPLAVSAGIDVVAGLDVAPVREAVKAALREFLSPLTGGHERGGWPLEKAVEDRELWARAARVDGVSKVRGLWMWDETRARLQTVPLRGLELPRIDSISVSIGEPEDLAAAPPTPPPDARKRVPVPVLLPECS